MATKDFKPIGQLIDFQWRLGVAVKSHNNPNLGTPFVTLLLKVADSDNIVKEHTLELNLAEFHVRIVFFSSSINALVEDCFS